jgi:predicted outer membrane protein
MTERALESWFTTPLHGIRRSSRARKNQRRRHRLGRGGALVCEVLEGRVVLSDWGGGSILGSLSYVGIVTRPIVAPPVMTPPIVPMPWANQNSQFTQLNNDVQTLRTELQTLAGRSGVTIADLESLTSDGQTIAQAGYHFDFQNLNKVVSELATAVAGGTSTMQAQSDCSALFTGSSVTTSTINTTFSNLVKTITDSQVTTTDLSTVANDEAAIQADLKNLYPPPGGGLAGGGWWSDPADNLSLFVSTPPIVVSAPAILADTPTSATSVPVGIGIPIRIGPFWGSSLLLSLDYVGVVSGPIVVPTQPPPMEMMPPWPGPNSQFTQLNTDIEALRTELQTLAAKSGVTIADLQGLTTDSQSIAQAGFHFDFQSLNKVVSELAAAVAGGASTAQAQSDWNSLFAGSSVSTTLINNTCNGVVQTIKDSNVTTTDLSTVANDRAAIQADLKNLRPTPVVLGGKGTGSTGGPGTNNYPGSSKNSTGATGRTPNTSHHHKGAGAAHPGGYHHLIAKLSRQRKH